MEVLFFSAEGGRGGARGLVLPLIFGSVSRSASQRKSLQQLRLRTRLKDWPEEAEKRRDRQESINTNTDKSDKQMDENMQICFKIIFFHNKMSQSTEPPKSQWGLFFTYFVIPRTLLAFSTKGYTFFRQL